MTKICTSLQQSKKLVELGIDVNTADMRYGYIAPYEYSDRMYEGGYNEVPYPKDFLKNNPNFSENDYDGEFPAWSLSALLNIIPEPYLVQNSEGTWLIHSWVNKYPWSVGGYSNPIDACVEMIVKLHEKEIL